MKKEYLYAGLCVLLWSTMATMGKLLLGSYNGVQILCVSSLLAGMALLTVNLVFRKNTAGTGYRAKDYLYMILVGLPGTFFYYIFYYAGAAGLLASQAFIINYMWPIMSIVFACLLLGEKLTARKAFAIVLSFVGVMFVAGPELLLLDKNSMLGMGLCFGAAVSYGLFTALSKKTGYDSCMVTMLSFFSAFVLSAAVMAVQGGWVSMSMRDVLGMTWNGLFAMAVPNTLWLVALAKGDTAKISNLAYITPFLSMVWSMLILKERPGILSFVGLAVMVGGIFVQMRDPSVKEKQE